MSWNEAPLIDWLLSEGRFCATAEDMVDGLGRALVDVGAPLWRLRLSMRTLHPLMMAISVVWLRDKEEPNLIETPHGLEARGTHIGSPLERISETGKPFRKDLTALTDADHHVLAELRAQGGTDYYGLPLRFAFGAGGILVFASDAAKGFSDDDILKFDRIASVMAPIAETFRLRQLSVAVSDAYLGPRTGPLVLDGRITRGEIETIEAAIMVSDIRNWTELNSKLEPSGAMSHLNRYFELLDTRISAYQGEILKFMGDGLLAVFPADGDPSGACTRALLSAQEAIRMARQDGGALPLGFGIGLHVGNVLYGNIGSQHRLDFTVLGQAVNLTARIEALCRDFAEPILVSEAFATAVGGTRRSLPPIRVKGIDTPVTVFAPET